MVFVRAERRHTGGTHSVLTQRKRRVTMLGSGQRTHFILPQWEWVGSHLEPQTQANRPNSHKEGVWKSQIRGTDAPLKRAETQATCETRVLGVHRGKCAEAQPSWPQPLHPAQQACSGGRGGQQTLLFRNPDLTEGTLHSFRTLASRTGLSQAQLERSGWPPTPRAAGPPALQARLRVCLPPASWVL